MGVAQSLRPPPTPSGGWVSSACLPLLAGSEKPTLLVLLGDAAAKDGPRISHCISHPEGFVLQAFSKLKQSEMWEWEGRRDGCFAGILAKKAFPPWSASLMTDLGTSIPRVTTGIVVMIRIHFGSGCPHLPLAGSGKQSSASSEIINMFVK